MSYNQSFYMMSVILGRYPMPVLNFTITCGFQEELIIMEIGKNLSPVNKVYTVHQPDVRATATPRAWNYYHSHDLT